MLTSSMPGVTRALSGSLSPGAIQQLTQAIGNCNQPLTHRGGINAQPPGAVGLNQGGPGAITGGTWNPRDYIDLLPPTNEIVNIVLPGYEGPGAWNVSNYAGDNFFFPTSQEFTTNQYYGGPTFNVGGDTVLENTYSNNMYVTNLVTETINGAPAPGAPGADGPSGPPGLSGAAGLNGVDGNAGGNGINGNNGIAGNDGADGMDGLWGLNGLPGAPGANGRDAVNQRFRFVPTRSAPVRLIDQVSFDPVTCTIFAHYKTIQYVTGGTVEAV